MPDVVLIIMRRSREPNTKEKLSYKEFYQMFPDIKGDHPGDLGVSERLILFSIVMINLQRLLARMAYLSLGLRKSLKKSESIFILFILLPDTYIIPVGRCNVQNARALIWSKDGRSPSFDLYSPKWQVSVKKKIVFMYYL